MKQDPSVHESRDPEVAAAIDHSHEIINHGNEILARHRILVAELVALENRLAKRRNGKQRI